MLVPDDIGDHEVGLAVVGPYVKSDIRDVDGDVAIINLGVLLQEFNTIVSILWMGGIGPEGEGVFAVVGPVLDG